MISINGLCLVHISFRVRIISHSNIFVVVARCMVSFCFYLVRDINIIPSVVPYRFCVHTMENTFHTTIFGIAILSHRNGTEQEKIPEFQHENCAIQLFPYTMESILFVSMLNIGIFSLFFHSVFVVVKFFSFNSVVQFDYFPQHILNCVYAISLFGQWTGPCLIGSFRKSEYTQVYVIFLLFCAKCSTSIDSLEDFSAKKLNR